MSPAYKATAKGAMYATLATVKVSGFVAKRVGSLSKGVSNYLAKKVCWKLYRYQSLLLILKSDLLMLQLIMGVHIAVRGSCCKCNWWGWRRI